VSPDPEFGEAIAKFYSGVQDRKTLDLLAS
jgi:uncharacterized protein (DUF1810 family)